MPRNHRIEFPGALPHGMSRGDRGGDIVFDDVDRQVFERRMEERRAIEANQQITTPLRRGWRLGSEDFCQEMLKRLDGPVGAFHSGELRPEGAEAKAERIIGDGIEAIELEANAFGVKAQRRSGQTGAGGAIAAGDDGNGAMDGIMAASVDQESRHQCDQYHGLTRMLKVFSVVFAGILSALVAEAREFQYRLLFGSTYANLCPVCRVVPQPVRGTMTLVLTNENPLFAEYEIRDISWRVGELTTPLMRVTGVGRLQIGGEVAVTLTSWFRLTLDDGSNPRTLEYSNADPFAKRQWPMVEVTVSQANPTVNENLTFNLALAPLQDLWFSTRAGLTAGKLPGPANRVSAGDLLSLDGRVVRSHGSIIGALGFMPTMDDVNLDAIHIAHGGEILSSLASDQFSERLGLIQHGDIVSDEGKVSHTLDGLLSAFNPALGRLKVGLDAVQVMDSGEVYFSIATNLALPAQGRVLSRGDILSQQGRVVRAHAGLLAAFKPPSPVDYGVDAFHVWPDGEVWFSLQTGISGSTAGAIHEADILSDWGYVVFQNLELVSAFVPLERVSTFGLDSLFVITDVSPPPLAPRFRTVRHDWVGAMGALLLGWDLPGRVVQLESAAQVAGPFTPVGPITPDQAVSLPAPPGGHPHSFFRLRSW